MKERYYPQVACILQDLLGRAEVQRMQQFVQHGNISTFDHCLSVALLSYALVKILHLPVNLRTLVLGAFLHDFYLYDWHCKGHVKLHGLRHPRIAQQNAATLLHQPAEVTEIIYSHMWPLTFRCIPCSLEGWVVCVADKTVTVQEVLRGWRDRLPPG